MTVASERHRRFLEPHRHLAPAFGDDAFGRAAERVARFFGTPQYLVGQTLVVVVWIALNGWAIIVHFDPYPFILLNLAFSTQAAYAAPLILLAQTRQADRDKAHADADARHREDLAQRSLRYEQDADEHTRELRALIEQNTALTEETRRLAARIDELTCEIHGRVVDAGPPRPS